MSVPEYPYPSLIILAALAVAAIAGDIDSAKGEKEKLEGIWISTAITSAGKNQDLEVRMEFKGDKVIVAIKGEATMTGSYTIDLQQSPAAMDLTSEKEGKKVTIPAIYELEGDEFTMCHAFAENGARPNRLEATEKTVLAIFKRQKR